MKKKMLGIVVLGSLCVAMLSGCIEHNIEDVKVISGYLESVESVNGYLIVNLENAGSRKFYYERQDGVLKSNEYIEIYSYTGHNVDIFYYDNYWSDGDDKFFHIILND